MPAVLSSLWGDLDPLLIGSFVAMRPAPRTEEQNRAGAAIEYEVDPDQPVVKAAVQANSFTPVFQQNWVSPFESLGPDSKAPLLAALVQGGQAEQAVALARTRLGDALEVIASNSGAASIDDFLKSSAGRLKDAQNNGTFQGRTGITKVNSTQIYSGMPPVQLGMTVEFWADYNPVTQVERPLNQLIAWALPQMLASQGVLLGAAVKVGSQGVSGLGIDTLLPSKAPTVLQFSYAGRTWPPCVIESIVDPQSGPRTKTGRHSVSVPITMTTLQALDQNDWRRIALLGPGR